MSENHAILPGEEWRDIPGYEGRYQASSLGRIKSVGRIIQHRPSGKIGAFRKSVPERILVQSASELGYRSVNLSRNGVAITQGVHRLVLLAFVGPCPEGMEACHFPDRDPGNNRTDNLRWGTKKENMADMLAHGTSCKGRKMSPEQCAIISAAKSGSKMSAEGRTRLSVARKKQWAADAGVRGERLTYAGRKHSPESKAKMAEARRRFWAKKREGV